MMDVMDLLGLYNTINPSVQGKILSSVVLIFAIWLLRFLLLTGVLKKVEDVRIRYRWRKTSQYVCFTFAVAALSIMWFKGVLAGFFIHTGKLVEA